MLLRDDVMAKHAGGNENFAGTSLRPRLVPELICTDLDRSLEFYVGLVGFRVLYARPDERFAFLDRDGPELMLEQPTTRDRLWPKAELTRPFGRGVNFEIQVSNVDELNSVLLAAGHECFLPMETRWYRRDDFEMGVRQFAVQDPDGYLIRLSQRIGIRSSKR
jgi:catechol 2,3-dioxygenase-like lactoylglutathione lyase family enzyme